MTLSGVFYPVGNDVGGRVSGASYGLDGVTYLSVTGLNINVPSYSAALNTFFNGNDTYLGSWGNDHFYAYSGNDIYSGGAGVDTVHYNVARSYFTITGTSSYTLRGLNKTDFLTGVERVAFTNGTLALDVKAGENAGSAYRAYQAAFDRKPDAAGLSYWMQKMDAGASLAEVAMGFVQSNEFQQLNPVGNTAGMITAYYKNVLHRAPDAGGQAFWSNQAASGMQAHEMLAAFSESTENINNTAAALQGGIWLAA